jgi:hypothetical protein
VATPGGTYGALEGSAARASVLIDAAWARGRGTGGRQGAVGGLRQLSGWPFLYPHRGQQSSV